MSKFNKKGYRNMLAYDENNNLRVVPVKVGGKHDKRRAQAVKKLKKERSKAFTEYKDNLKEMKKRVPAHLRASINWSKTPDMFLGGNDGNNNDTEAKPMH